MDDSSDKSIGVKQMHVIASGDSSSKMADHPVINNKSRFRESVGQAMDVLHEEPITLCVHHLSPVGRLMNTSTFQLFHRRTNQDEGLLRIEVGEKLEFKR